MAREWALPLHMNPAAAALHARLLADPAVRRVMLAEGLDRDPGAEQAR